VARPSASRPTMQIGKGATQAATGQARALSP
jgi:hypothetical protein